MQCLSLAQEVFLGKLGNVNNYHHHHHHHQTCAVVYLINKINNIVCLQIIIRLKNKTRNSALCPFFSNELDFNIKYITSPLGQRASGGLNKIAQLAMKAFGSGNKRVATMIITKFVRKKSVKPPRIQTGNLSWERPWAFCLLSFSSANSNL